MKNSAFVLDGLLRQRLALRWFACLSLLFAITRTLTGESARATPTWLKAQVVSALDGRPIPGARFQLRVRQLTTSLDGIPILGTLDESSLLLSSEAADSPGRFQVPCTSPSSVTYLSIRVNAPGYEEYLNSLVRLDPGTTNEMACILIPNQLTKVEAEYLEIQRVAVRDLQYWNMQEEQTTTPAPEKPSFGIPRSKSLKDAVIVPDKVPVSVTGFSGLMDLDEYIAGVVTAELGDSFHPEALKTQAVAARSYALARLASRGIASGGQAYSSVHGTKSTQASKTTTKTVMTYQGIIISAYFSARCNGDTTLNSEDGPTLENCTRGGLGAGFVPYCRARPCSGHINCSQTAEQCCELVLNGKTEHIYGHGVGMCQRGAQDFASKQGLGWTNILQNYYTGVQIVAGSAAPPVLSQPALSGFTFSFALNGTANSIWIIQASSNLSNWTAVSTNTIPSSGSQVISNSTPAGAQPRFYRAINP